MIAVTLHGAPTAPRQPLLEGYGRIPLSFEANRGQTASQVQFLARGNGYSLFLMPAEAVLALSRPAEAVSDVLRMKIVGGSSSARAVGLEQTTAKSNYLIGNDPAKWHTDVTHYAKVRYQSVYPGVDLVYYGHQRQLEYDFVVAPGAGIDRLTLSFEGAENIQIDAEGNLVLRTPGGQLTQHKPIVYQEDHGKRLEIAGSYVKKGEREVGFEVAAYDRSRPLIIDPVLSYSTYLGGSGIDQALGIAVDATGNAYVTGLTNSADFPITAGAFQGTLAGSSDVFVTKLDPSGTMLIYSTFLGGSGNDQGADIAVDSAGNAYVAGLTASNNFPTTATAFQSARSGSNDAFVTKLNSSGSGLLYSTFLGGSANDIGRDIAIDLAGNAYATGLTLSTDLPTANAFQSSSGGGGSDAFVAKVNVNASGAASLVYSTYLGGSGDDVGSGIAINPATGNALVTGSTSSAGFPTTTAALDTTCGTDGACNEFDDDGDLVRFADAFVTALNSAGSGLVYSTFLGGGNTDSGRGIAVDSAGNAYVTGETLSMDFPTANAFESVFAGSSDAFVTKLNASGNGLVYSTFLGGVDTDTGNRIALDSAGSAYVTGLTFSAGFPTTADATQGAFGGISDAFVTKLNLSGNGITFSSFLGGSDKDAGNGLTIAIAVDPTGNAYVTGETRSSDFPTTSDAFQTISGGGAADSFVAKFTDLTTVPVPTNKDQCKNGGWQSLQRANGTLFKNQGDCVSYVNTGK